MMLRLLCACLVALPSLAAAEEDYMEVQRCVWRCLHGSPGAESQEYQQCVADKCNDPVAAAPAPQAAPPQPPAVAGPPWSQGATQDGLGFFAGQVAPEAGTVLYYTCDTGGAQNLILSGRLDGPAAVLNLDADGQVIGLWFEATPGGLTSRLEPGSPLPGLIAAVRRLEVRSEAGQSLGTFAMAGAGPAINAARAACGL
jgi:hypothetical protein